MMVIAAIVPMRHDSERVPGKNYRKLGGVPLYHHVIRTLSSCSLIDIIFIDTDSPIILDDAARSFPHAVCYERPRNLCDGELSMNIVLQNSIKQVDADVYLQTHSTNPFLRFQTVEEAIELFLKDTNSHDSLFSVRRIQSRLWGEHGVPINHDPSVLLRTQDLTPYYEENSCIYLFTRECFLKRKNRIGDSPMLFEMDPFESLDIDEEFDFQLAESIMTAGIELQTK